MELNGEVAIGAPRERVWSALNDNDVLRACIPGCEELVQESDSVRRARVMVKAGPVRARFNGTLTLSDVQAPQRCAMGFEGSGGAAGMATGSAKVELHEDADGTRVTYAVRASVGGKLGQIGGRMIDAAAKQLADQFFQALRAQLAPVPASPQDGVPPGASPLQQAATLAAPSPGLPAAPLVARVAAPPGEASRVLWFLLGVASTALGVWLGKALC
ncbi:SRPBCC domain-containing protein [Caenimonas terrae]|uniref:SRPBCC domain-containing protein n=1 Tax=Caenimonas terrae TaxID=696074 RepID=A0ABW0N6Z0_9BURK